MGFFTFLVVGVLFNWLIALMCGILMFVVHFFGWFENMWMSIIRGLLEALALLPLMMLTKNFLPVLFCVLAFHGAWHLRYYDPHIGVDWWHVCLFFIGLSIGTGVVLC